MPRFSSPLKNPFDSKERDSNRAAFVKDVLGKGDSKPKVSKKEDFGTEDDLKFSAEDKKKIEDERIFSKIIARESHALRKFFGKEIPIPALPKEATRERILEWRILGLELHYLPHLSVAEIKRAPNGRILEVVPIEFPGWKNKPGEQYTSSKTGIDFFGDIKLGRLDPSVLDLPGAWVLTDVREKPSIGNEYEDDPLASTLEELRKVEVVEYFEREGSRFRLSPEELKNPKVLEAFAKALNLNTIPGLVIGIPRAIEFNILGNIYYPQWGMTDTAEWFSDKYQGNSGYLYGGRSGRGGLSYVFGLDPRDRFSNFGFRVIGRFFSDQKETQK